MKIEFQSEKYPNLNLTITVEPKFFGPNIEIEQENATVSIVDKKKNRYKVEVGDSTYNCQIKNTPFETKLIINKETHELIPKNQWYNYIIGGLPFVLIISGGAIGAGFGLIGWTANMNFLRYSNSNIKYAYVAGITIFSAIAYLITVTIFYSLLE